MSSKINDDLIASYHSAVYHFGVEPSAIGLCIDQYSEPLSRVIAESGDRFAVRSGPVCLNSDLSILSGISADSHAASLTVGSITA